MMGIVLFFITIDSIHSATSNVTTDNCIVYYEVFSLVLVLFAIISCLLYAHVARYFNAHIQCKNRSETEREWWRKKAFASITQTERVTHTQFLSILLTRCLSPQLFGWFCERKCTFLFIHSRTKVIQLLWFRFVQRILKWFDAWLFSFGVEIKRKCHYVYAFCIHCQCVPIASQQSNWSVIIQHTGWWMDANKSFIYFLSVINATKDDTDAKA